MSLVREEDRKAVIKTLAIARRAKKLGMTLDQYQDEFDRPWPICDEYLTKDGCEGCPFVDYYGTPCYNEEKLGFDMHDLDIMEDVWCSLLIGERA